MSDKPTPRGAAGGLDSGDRIPDGRNFLDPVSYTHLTLPTILLV